MISLLIFLSYWCIDNERPKINIIRWPFGTRTVTLRTYPDIGSIFLPEKCGILVFPTLVTPVLD